MTDPTTQSRDALEAAARAAITHRDQWKLPAVIVRFEDNGEFLACPQESLSNPAWPDRDRFYEVIAEFDRGELEELAQYTDDNLHDYVADVLTW